MKKDPTSNNAQLAPLPLVPEWVLLPMWFVSLALPNLVYSGVSFADTLHILKWTVTGVPIAVAVLVAGARLCYYGAERIKIKIDLFAVIWALILIYCALQPLWVKLFSPTAYALEMVCFVTIWAFYVISVSSFPEWGLRPILILANLNAAINILFAELQIRNINDWRFLSGTFLEGLRQYSSIILPTPGNYIGNTAQQNMFGLWIAVAVLGAVYLFVFDAWKNHDEDEHGKKIWLPALSVSLAVVCFKFAITQEIFVLGILGGLFIVAAFVLAFKLGNQRHLYFSVFLLLIAGINFWGLMNSTSRSATLALIGGLLLMLIISAWKFNRYYVIRFFAVLLVIVTVFWASLYAPRSGEIVNKTKDIIEHAETIGLRRGIWATSYAMLNEHPQGVGIGQFKWHYLEAQRYGFKFFNNANWYDWQYTHWAHNEFLQFFCEGGYAGGVMFLLMYLTWFIPAVVGLFRKKQIDITSVWALCLASLITFCAVFTRPFHRIENMVWITLAFAISNREFFVERMKFDLLKPKFLARLAGVACIAASISGCVYIAGGIYGNYVLRQALSTNNPQVQLYLLNEANKYPIVREDTQRHLAYHFMQVGEQTNNKEALANGFNILWQQFNREPHSEDIGRLLTFVQKYQIEGVLRELASYFKPGTYHLERRPQRDSNGRVLNALLLIPGPGENAR